MPMTVQLLLVVLEREAASIQLVGRLVVVLLVLLLLMVVVVVMVMVVAQLVVVMAVDNLVLLCCGVLHDRLADVHRLAPVFVDEPLALLILVFIIAPKSAIKLVRSFELLRQMVV